MALTNTQYDAIARVYEERQRHVRLTLEQKKEAVYRKIPQYRMLEEEIASFAVSCATDALEDSPNLRQKLSAKLKEFSSQKKELLSQAGFPENYLEPVYSCMDCKDTGYIDNKKCHCFRQYIINYLYSLSHIEKVLEQQNFSTLTLDLFEGKTRENYEKTVAVCHSFVDNFDKEERSLLFTGTVGTGKTFLTNCIAKALLDSYHSVVYFSAVDLFQMISDYVFSKEHDDSSYQELFNYDLLIIDDLGTEVVNAFVNSYFFSLINERKLRGKSTIISTNLGLKGIESRYSERIVSRIISFFDICVLSGPDLRIRKLS